jgi:hypothetical protein
MKNPYDVYTTNPTENWTPSPSRFSGSFVASGQVPHISNLNYEECSFMRDPNLYTKVLCNLQSIPMTIILEGTE